uniref:Nicotinamide nucleotide repair protein n=1 Tax=mine drainage metagenome TaxID=410659 RepID=E6PSL0_9ZZZZ
MMHRMTGLQQCGSLPVWDTAALRRIEHDAASGLPPHGLMQRAGDAIARLARARFPHARQVTMLCGPGNNGGDGLVAAAALARHGLQVSVWMVACGAAADWQRTTRPADWLWALQLARDAGLQPLPWTQDAATWAWQGAGLIIDALLGIGLNRAPEGEMAAAMAALAQHPAPVLAVDLPSGLASDTGTAPGEMVRVEVTLTLLGLKPGLLTGPDAHACGELWLDDLDAWGDLGDSAISRKRRTTPSFLDPLGGRLLQGSGLGALTPKPDATAMLLGAADAIAALPQPGSAAHKGERGDVHIFGGAMGMTGAALLAARAALALGAGRVFAALLDPQAPSFDAARPELMLRKPQALLEMVRHAPTREGRCCVVFGPGAGMSAEALSILQALLALDQPLVIDADGLNLLAGQARDGLLWQALQQRRAPTWLTPHPREAAGLLQWDTARVQADRLSAARTLAAQSRAHCVLKGAGSVMTTPDGAAWINPSGNGLLATAGSGDVLTGTLAACIAPARNPNAAIAAARAAVWLHGAGADLAREEGQGLRAGTLPDAMVRARTMANGLPIDMDRAGHRL